MSRRLVNCVFLSRVNREFGDCDALIRGCLKVSTDYTDVQDQTAFAHEQDGHGTLRKLLNKLRHADAAIHYVGSTLGTKVEAPHADRFLTFEPALASWLDKHGLRAAAQAWTYTQWEAYLVLFLQDEATSSSREPIALLCYTVTWPSATPDPEIAAHWHALEAFEKFPTKIELTEHHRSSEGGEDCARKLADHFREGELSFPRYDAGVDRQKSIVEDLLHAFVERELTTCQELAALAFPVCADVLDLPVGTADATRFIAHLVERLANERDKHGLPALLVLLHAVRVLLTTCDKEAAGAIGAAAAALARELHLEVTTVESAYKRQYPSSFPAYPLYFAIQIYIKKIADAKYAAEISFRVGDHQQFVDPDRPVDSRDDFGAPHEAVHLALNETARMADRLGGVERFELMFDRTALQSDDDYRPLLTTSWNDCAQRLDDEEAEPIVLRWPHNDRSVRTVKKAPPDATVTLDEACRRCGVNVLHGDAGGDALLHWKRELRESTLMLWEREAKPTPACGEIPWREAPRRLRDADLRHIGVAMNPPDALAYKPRGATAAEHNLRTAIRLGL